MGTELEISFRLSEDGGELINARAEVVREERSDKEDGRSGMGIRFLGFESQSEVALARLFVGPRLRMFVEEYLQSSRAKKQKTEEDRVVDALAAWELLQVTRPEDPWRPGGSVEPMAAPKAAAKPSKRR